MKLKSFIAGALGLLLFLAGQNAAAQESTFPAPDRNTSTLPAPDRDSSTLPAPDTETSRLPPPDQASALPAPAAPPPPSPPPPPPSAAQAPVRPDSGSAGAQTGGQESAAGQERGTTTAPSTAAASGARRRWPGSLPQTGFYLGVMAGLAVPEYDINDTDWEDYGGSGINGYTTFNGGLFLGIDFGLFAGEAGFFFTGDSAETSFQNSYGSREWSDMTGAALHIPLLVKMDFHLGPVVLQPLLGPYFNIALGPLHTSGFQTGDDPYANPPVGLVFGGLAGLNLGRGILFIDGRYEIDLGRTVAGNDSITIWRRSAFMLNLGYQIYLGGRK